MKLAIHHNNESFSKYWINYCIENNINYKVVNCYNNDIIDQLKDCDALMWHHHHQNPKDLIFAKQLLFALEAAGKIVFPDFTTGWHFDDKLAQKYLFESINAPLAPTWVFYDKKEALKWVETTSFPKVFKLRAGSGSKNVYLVCSSSEAKRLIKKSFGRGMPVYDPIRSLRERWRVYQKGETKINALFKGIARFFVKPPYAKLQGREKGFVYFQEFIPDNIYDIRIKYVNNRCFALRRKVRDGDFRASGSGEMDYDLEKIPLSALRIAFDIASKLKLQSAAFDFVMHNEEPKIIEISYGFGYEEVQFSNGYWNENLEYIPGSFNPFAWMVESVLSKLPCNE